MQVTGVSTGPRTRAEYATAYAAIGWAVVPLYWIDEAGNCACGNPHDGTPVARADGTLTNFSPNSRGKHPHSLFAPHGALSASKDPAILARWFSAEPRLNIGIATGEASNIVAVDIDPRDGGDETWTHFVERNGGDVPDTVIAQTGGGGLHIIFKYQADQVIRTPGKGIQIKGNGGYIVAEPSLHHSGRLYGWDAESDPLEGFEPVDAPEWLVTPKTADVLKMKKGGGYVGFLSPQRIADLQAALKWLDPDAYETWFQVGMALHSTDAPEGFELWDEWAQRSSKYTTVASRAKWCSFGQREGLHVESVFAWAAAAGWSGESEQVVTPRSALALLADSKHIAIASAGDMGLHELPGALGDLVRVYNETAPRRQPDFAVSTALVLGSVIAGRRYVAKPRNNFTSLYFVNVGKSASGKEYPRTLIDATLTAADWPELVGQSGYTSDAAVFSALLHQPTHVAIIDELGALLGNSQSEGMHYARAAMTMLVEAWGNCHGTMRPKAYATLSLPKDQAEAMLKRVVYNPAITLLGMTTPRTFYNSLTEASIEGGFLSRLIVVQTDIGRQPMGEAADLVIPSSVLDWIKASRSVAAERGNLAAVVQGAANRPITTPVPTLPGALAAFRAYELESIKGMDALEDEGLAELEGRSVEKAMRIATILAVSVDPIAPKVTAELAEYAIRYIRHWTERTVAAVRENMNGSKFAQWQAEFLAIIVRGGEKGRTNRELARCSKTYNGLEIRQRNAVMAALKERGAIDFTATTGQSGRGRKRNAWVALDPNVISEDADE